MRRLAVWLTATLAVSLAVLLAGGCSAAPAGPYRPTGATCYAFAVRAIQRHVTVAAVPGACAGLSQEQVNQAAARAIRDLTAGQPKAAARRQARQDGAYLARLVSAIPALRPPAPPAPAATATQATVLAPARPAADLALSLAALGAWVLTAAAGAYLLAGWLADRLARGHWRRRAGGRAGETVNGFIVGHFVLALAGLVCWITFVVTRLAALAWVAVVLVVIIASLGMAVLAAALPEPGRDGAAAGGRRLPVAVIAVHGLLATLTILLVVLAALG